MTPDRLREILAVLHWSQRALADILSCDDRLVRRWAASEAAIPTDIAEWLDRLNAAHIAHPPPTAWKRRAA